MRAMPEPPNLLLLPGLLCDERLWRDQVAALGGAVACLVADTTLDDNLAAMAARALAAAPQRFALAGLSMGGYLAFEILRQAPGRVTRLALLDTSARPDTPEQARRRRGADGADPHRPVQGRDAAAAAATGASRQPGRADRRRR